MTASRGGFAPLLILGAGVVFLVFMLVVGPQGGDSGDILLLLAGAGFTTVGALIGARTDGNRVGWVASATGLTLLGSGMVGYWADRGWIAADAIGGAMWLSWFFLVGLLMFWFPTGKALSPRWRWVGWFGLAIEILALTYIVSDQLCVGGGDPCSVWVDNPIGISGMPNPEYGRFGQVNFALLASFTFLSGLSLIVRYLRSHGIERLQIKWFAFAVASVVAVIILQENIADLPGVPVVVGDFLFGVSVLTIPVALGVSVLKYRLYDIDRIVSRTVSYTLVVGILAAVYVGGVTWLTSLLPDQSQLVVAATTLAVATLFNPVRRRIQNWVDRRFNRSRYDTQRVMDGFAGSLRDQVDPDQVVDGWVGVVSETMQPVSVAVWTRNSVRNDSGTVGG
jgi:hypothetical protein